VTEPANALPDGETVRLLDRLSRCLLRIVIVSGRDTDLLAGRIPVDGVTIIGNHGLEERDGHASRVIAEARPYVAAIQRAAASIDHLEAVRQPGISVERKRATLSVHFRNAANPQSAGSALATALREIAAREGLVLRPGRLVWEVRPPLPVDKGEALRRLARSLHAEGVIYAGDDVTDADAFRVLTSMRPQIRTLGIGVRSAEVPEQAFAAADLLVDGVPGVKQVLGELRTLCGEHSGATSR
jgi:trehalose 6-phosphate phosphatase